MSQRTKVTGTRSCALWLLALIAIILIAGMIVVGLILYPRFQAKQAEQVRLVEAEQHYQAGVAFQEVSDWDKAVEAFEKVVAINASHRDARVRLAQVKARQQEARAVAQAEAARATATAQARVEVTAAAATVEARAVQATSVAATATAQARATVQAQEAMATSTAEALTQLEAHYQKGLGHMNLSHWEEAKAELEQVFEVDPNYKEVQAKLAELRAEIAKLTPTATTTPIAAPMPSAYFEDDFNGFALDDTKWEIVGGIVSVSGGTVHLKSSSRTFPYIWAKKNPFPLTGDFVLRVQIRYPKVTGWGTGLAISTRRPPSGVSQDVMLEEETIWSIWQDANGWRIELKLDAMLRVYQLPAPETIQHLVELKYAKSQYHVYVDGQLVYTSSLTPARPSVLWFGNPVDVGSNGEWSSLEIDSILVVTS